VPDTPARALPARPTSLPSTEANSAIHNPTDRLRDIELIGERIGAIVRFMCEIHKLAGTSDECRDRALTVFHERLIAVEKQLAQIQEKFRLE
jgi:hypothetical protein